MKLSIIVPVYNIEQKYLEKCFNSLTLQNMQDVEFLVIDDGSTNNAPQVCDWYAKKDSRFKVVHQKNAGVSVARNRGLAVAEGEYIMFVDADDYLVNKDVSQQLYQCAVESNVDILIFQYVKTTEAKNRKICEFDNSHISAKMFNGRDIENLKCGLINRIDDSDGFLFGSPWGKIFQRKFLEQNNLHFVVGLKKAQDRVFMLDCVSRNASIASIRYVGYCYNDINENSVTHRINPNILKVLEMMDDEMMKIVGNNESDSVKQAVYMMRIQNLLECFHLYLFHPENNDSLLSKMRIIKEIIVKNRYKTSLDNLKQESYNKFARDRKIKIYLLRHNCIFLYTVLSVVGKAIKTTETN